MSDYFHHILIVDDDMDVARYVGRLLTRRGHRVTAVGLGQEALHITRNVRPDIIVLDVELPDMTGFEVCRQLRQAAATAQVPVVMITGARASCEACEYGLACGADEYIEKPFVADIFVMALERYLSRDERDLG